MFGVYGNKQNLKIGKVIEDHGLYAPFKMNKDPQYIIIMVALQGGLQTRVRNYRQSSAAVRGNQSIWCRSEPII